MNYLKKVPTKWLIYKRNDGYRWNHLSWYASEFKDILCFICIQLNYKKQTNARQLNCCPPLVDSIVWDLPHLGLSHQTKPKPTNWIWMGNYVSTFIFYLNRYKRTFSVSSNALHSVCWSKVYSISTVPERIVKRMRNNNTAENLRKM